VAVSFIVATGLLLALAALVPRVGRGGGHGSVGRGIVLETVLAGAGGVGDRSSEAFASDLPAERWPLRGVRGTALTPLRPSGMASLGGERIDVVSDGELVPAGTPIEVTRQEGTRVVVRRIPQG
jgi:membrane protein implicated in regulation of membrane protease activity